MKDESIIIKKLENLEDLNLLNEGDVIRTLKERHSGFEEKSIELRVYAGKKPDKRMEFLGITGPWVSPISGWLIRSNPERLGIKNGMLYIPFFLRDVETRLYTNKGQEQLDAYIQKRKIIDKSGLLPDYRWEEFIKRR